MSRVRSWSFMASIASGALLSFPAPSSPKSALTLATGAVLMPFNRPATIAVPDLRVENRAGRLFAGTGQDFQVSGAADVTQIDLYDEIGVFGISAKDFRGKLKDAGNVVLRINSPGGDVFQGLAI